MEVINRQQRRSRIGVRSIHYDVVQIEAWRDAIEVQCVVARSNLRTQSSGDLLLRGSQNILMNRRTAEENVDRDYPHKN